LVSILKGILTSSIGGREAVILLTHFFETPFDFAIELLHQEKVAYWLHGLLTQARDSSWYSTACG